MEFDDLFVSKKRFRVVRTLGGSMIAIPDPEGNYRAGLGRAIELYLTESSYPPSGIEIMVNSGRGKRMWRKAKRIEPRGHSVGYRMLAEAISPTPNGEGK